MSLQINWIANSVRWHGHMFKENDRVFSRAIEIKVEGQWKKGRLEKDWKKA